MLLSAVLLRHDVTWVCGRIFYLCCRRVYRSAVGLVVYTTRLTAERYNLTTTQTEDTATYPSNIVTKQQGGK